jgi:hypothetical protein
MRSVSGRVGAAWASGVVALGVAMGAGTAWGQRAQDAGASAASVTSASPFDGVWRFAGGDPERRALEASVARAVQGMGWIAEGIAAARLRERSPIPEVVTIRVQGGTIEYTGVRGRTFRTPADGTMIQAQNPQGEPITLSTRLQGAVMTRVGARADGSRREVLRVEGNILTIEGTVSSPRLPRPLTYRLTYRR